MVGSGYYCAMVCSKGSTGIKILDRYKMFLGVSQASTILFLIFNFFYVGLLSERAELYNRQYLYDTNRLLASKWLA